MLLLGLLLTALTLFAQSADAQMGLGGMENPVQVSAQLSTNPAVPGEEVVLAVVLDHAEHWHTQPVEAQVTAGGIADFSAYWTTLDLPEPPAGITFGEMRYPPLKVLDLPSLGGEMPVYSGKAIFYIPIDIAPEVAPGEIPLPVSVSYQACDDAVCNMPQTETIDLTLRIVPAAERGEAPAPDPKIFDEAAQAPDGEQAFAPPKPKTKFAYQAGLWSVVILVAAAMLWMLVRTFQITDKTLWRVISTAIVVLVLLILVASVRYFTSSGSMSEEELAAAKERFHEIWQPYSHEAFEEAIAAGKIPVLDFTADWCINCKVLERTVLMQPAALQAAADPRFAPMQADVTENDAPGHAKLKELGEGGIPRLAVYHPERAEPIQYYSFYDMRAFLAALDGEVVELEEGAMFDFFGWQFSVDSILFIVLLAVIAGFLLNFTPCVLPVIPIKVLSLHQQAGNPARCLALGVSFGLGIIAFFVGVGIPIAVLKVFDWGRMFSLPSVNIVLGLIILLMALGMMGLFSIRLPQKAYMFNPSHDTHTGSFLTGILTGLLSTPCTGPLLGAAIAWVVKQEWWLALGTFAAMGFGMAFPYVLLAANPKWVDRLPRTGAGSELVKQVMGILLIAVALYFFGLAGSAMGY